VRSRSSPPDGRVAHGRRIGCGSGWASARRSGGRRLDVEVAERVVFALVAQRALEPASKPAGDPLSRRAGRHRPPAARHHQNPYLKSRLSDDYAK
jgi:hypothetical protein